MPKEKMEITVTPEITLLSIQSGKSRVDNKMRHVIQEIVTQSMDNFYVVGGTRIGKDSFGQPYQANTDLTNPIVGVIGLKEDRETMLASVEAYFKSEIYPRVHNATIDMENLSTAISAAEYDINDLTKEAT